VDEHGGVDDDGQDEGQDEGQDDGQGGKPRRRAARRTRVIGGRKNLFGVRFTDAEADTVRAAAAEAQMTETNLIAEIVLAHLAGTDAQMSVVDRRWTAELVSALWRELRRSGVVLNQLAIRANLGQVPAAPEVEATLRYHRQGLAGLGVFLDRIDPGWQRRKSPR
jgi:hypothetical protein